MSRIHGKGVVCSGNDGSTRLPLWILGEGE